MTTQRIAAIDIGTNTALLLVADVAPDGTLKVVHDEERFVRLGQGVDASGRVNEAAMQRARVALLAHRATAERLGASVITLCATSASRDAQNKDELIAFVKQETGLTYEIISGEEEALWSFRGAVSGFPELIGPCLVADIGGGSTEVILGDPQAGDLLVRKSYNIGSVRLAERFFTSMPPAPPRVEAASELIRTTFADFPLDPDDNRPFIGSNGTTSTLALIHTNTPWRAAPELPAMTLDAADVHAWRHRLLRFTYDDVLALNPQLLGGRADVFPAGVLILDVFMQQFDIPAMQVTTRGLRHGLVLRAAMKD